jgi:hypothetical protein
MKSILLVSIIFLSYCSTFGEIRKYVLDQIEYSDGKSKDADTIPYGKGGASGIHREPILDMNNKAKTINLILAGLGSNHITAQCPIWNLSVESQLIPMKTKYGENKSDQSGAEWYYVMSEFGVTIIELLDNKKMAKLHNLGVNIYTYVGKFNPK